VEVLNTFPHKESYTFVVVPLRNMSEQKDVEVPIKDLTSIVHAALLSTGLRGEDAKVITDNLMYAEMRRNNQGVIKVTSGALNPSKSEGEIEIKKETPVSALVDGKGRIGMCVMKRCLDIGIEKARSSGVAVVSASGYKSATGALGYWAYQAAKEGFIYIMCCQCPEMVAPAGSYEAIFGTNPLAMGFPRGKDKPPVVLDMATSAEAWYHLKMSEAKGEPIRDDIAYDEHGRPTSSASAALKGALRTFGGHKGSGLALMVELLAGSLSGADMEDKWNAKRGWGTFMLLLKPELMGEEEDILAAANTMTARVQGAKRLQETVEVLYPGERGSRNEEETLRRGTIPIPGTVLARLQAMAGSQEN
jgi:LDH2 family malate/lactate/ureidoglycolate dehydrogenase